MLPLTVGSARTITSNSRSHSLRRTRHIANVKARDSANPAFYSSLERPDQLCYVCEDPLTQSWVCEVCDSRVCPRCFTKKIKLASRPADAPWAKVCDCCFARRRLPEGLVRGPRKLNTTSRKVTEGIALQVLNNL